MAARSIRLGHTVINGYHVGRMLRGQAQAAAEHRYAFCSAHHQSVRGKQAAGSHQRQVTEMPVPNGVDERSLDEGAEVVELTDQPPARSDPCGVSGDCGVEILLVHQPVEVDY